MDAKYTIDHTKDIGDQARDFAGIIYSLSEEAYMAHSIQAVKRYIRERKGNRQENFIIVVRAVSGVDGYSGRKSFVKVWPSKAIILVDKQLNREQKRMCIAHELFHILLCMETFLRTANFNKPDRSRMLEDSCDLFAKNLCASHHEFYCNRDKVLEFCTFTRFPKSDGTFYSLEEADVTDPFKSEN